MTANPHLEAKIDELIASGKTFSEVVRLAAEKDVLLVEKESEIEALKERIEALEAALEMFADESNWSNTWTRTSDRRYIWEDDRNDDPVALARQALEE
jgi:hypothetical protein